MAQSGSCFCASRNERAASTLAKAYINWKPWLKYCCASTLVDEMGRVKLPSDEVSSGIGSSKLSGNDASAASWPAAGAAPNASSAASNAADNGAGKRDDTLCKVDRQSQGSAKTKMLLPMLGRSSGVSARNDMGLPAPVLATMYCLPSTA